MYSEKIEFLKNKGIIKDVFDYRGLDNSLEERYKSFEDKFQKSLNFGAENFNIKNVVFYIKNGFSCNASASRIGKHNIITITNGYPILILEKFDKEYFIKVVLVALLNEKIISNAYVDLLQDSNFEFSQFMLECSLKYTFNHEFRHLLQFNSNPEGVDFSFNENLSKDEFSIKKHAWEFDADRIASYEVLKYVFRIAVNLKVRKSDKFICLLFLGLASMVITKILFYFGIMNQPQKGKDYSIEKQKFYTKKYSHPHPLMRISNIIEYYIENIKSDFPDIKIDSQTLLINITGILKLYLDSIIPKNNIMQDFFDDWISYSNEIDKYNDEIYDYAINDKSIRELLILRGVKFEEWNYSI